MNTKNNPTADPADPADPVDTVKVYKRPTIYEIKSRVKNAPYYFARETMRAWHQTLKMFSVHRLDAVHFLIACPLFEGRKYTGQSVRIFNAATDCFVSEREYNATKEGL